MALSHMIQLALCQPPFPHAVATPVPIDVSLSVRATRGYLGLTSTYDKANRMATTAAERTAQSAAARDRSIIQLCAISAEKTGG